MKRPMTKREVGVKEYPGEIISRPTSFSSVQFSSASVLPVEICGRNPTMEAGDVSYDLALCSRHPFRQWV